MADKSATKPDSTTIKISTEAASRLRTIADARDITIPEALDKYAGAAIAREYKRVVNEMHERVFGGESGNES